MINIIGRGNVATHLYKALKEYDGLINLVNPHTLDNFNKNAEITIVSVSDDAIDSVLSALPEVNKLVAHTSGSTSIDIFKNHNINRYGVFYPLQTFSKDKELDYSRIPFFIEASDKDSEEKLFNLALKISDKVRLADSLQRKKLHVASVLSCNFVNHLWALSNLYLKENNLNFTDLLPLIEETLRKVKEISPEKAQTGPAVRGDIGIINNHLAELENNSTLQNIYKVLSNSIIALKNKEQQ